MSSIKPCTKPSIKEQPPPRAKPLNVVHVLRNKHLAGNNSREPPSILQGDQSSAFAEEGVERTEEDSLVEGTLVEGSPVEDNPVEGSLVEDTHPSMDTLEEEEHRREVDADRSNSLFGLFLNLFFFFFFFFSVVLCRIDCCYLNLGICIMGKLTEMEVVFIERERMENTDLESNGELAGLKMKNKEVIGNGGIKTAHNMSSSLLRKKSDPILVSKVRFLLLRQFLANIQEVILGTKLCVLFPTIPLAIAAQYFNFGRPWIFALSLFGLAPLAERVSFLTEQIAYFTGPTVGGLLNATCGNATELIIALFALHQKKMIVVKYSLLGSILSNLLLVLGSSLLCGGLANLNKDQRFDRKQADVNSQLLLLGLLCHVVPLVYRYAVGPSEMIAAASSTLELSRVSSILMLVAYVAYLVFQLKTHRQFFEAQEDDENEEEERAVIGFWSAFTWLVGMTIIIALLSEYVVGTIEDASDSWGISISFISIILLPIVGNAAEHAGSIIFAFKNKLDISLGVALGSATQISMFVVPLCVVVGWIIGVPMDLDFSLLETSCLTFSILITAFTLQDGTSHYMKGIVLCLCYMVISTCFFVHKIPQNQVSVVVSRGSY